MSFIIDLAFVVSGLSCLILLVPVLKWKTWALQYPFCLGIVSTCVLFFQATTIYVNLNESPIPKDAFLEALVMFFLCNFACILGHAYRGCRSWSTPIIYDTKRLLICGLILIMVGWFGYFKLTSLSGGLLSFFSIEGGYSYRFEGLPVRYNFFVNMVYPGLVLALISYLRKPGKLAGMICFLGLLIPLGYIIFLGRRSLFVMLMIIILSLLYFHKGVIPPRPLALLAPFVCFFVLVLFPYFRQYSQLGADRSNMSMHEAKSVVIGSFDSDKAEIFRNGTYLIGAISNTGKYGFGLSLLDGIISNFIPRQLVGAEFRQRLMFRGRFQFGDETTQRVYFYTRQPNQFIGGFAELYGEFWYFGSLFFFGLGYLFKDLWIRATYMKSSIAQILFATLMVPAIISIAYSPSYFINSAILNLIILSVVHVFLTAGKAKPYKARYSWNSIQVQYNEVPKHSFDYKYTNTI